MEQTMEERKFSLSVNRGSEVNDTIAERQCTRDRFLICFNNCVLLTKRTDQNVSFTVWRCSSNNRRPSQLLGDVRVVGI